MRNKEIYSVEQRQIFQSFREKAAEEARELRPSILIINIILILFIIFGAKTIDMIYVLFVQMVVTSIFVPLRILLLKDYRIEPVALTNFQRTIKKTLAKDDSTTHIGLTKRKAIKDFIYSFLFVSGLSFYGLYHTIGLEGLSYSFLWSGFLIHSVYETIYTIVETQRKKTYKDTLTNQSARVYHQLIPILFVIILHLIMPSLTFVLIGTFIFKAYFDYVMVQRVAYKRMVLGYIAEKQERLLELDKKISKNN